MSTRSFLLQQITRILEESRFDIESDASLSRACSLELKDHCGDLPKGDGQSMDFLVNIFVCHANGAVECYNQCCFS